MAEIEHPTNAGTDGTRFLSSGIVFLDSLGEIGEKVFEARRGFADILAKADERFNEVDGRLTNIENNIGVLRTDVRSLKTDVAKMDKKMDVMKVELKADMSNMKTELRGEMANMKTELRGEMANMKTELKDEMANMKTELKDEISTLRSDIQALAASFARFENNFQQSAPPSPPSHHDPEIGTSTRAQSPSLSIPPEAEGVVDALAGQMMDRPTRDQARGRAMRIIRSLGFRSRKESRP